MQALQLCNRLCRWICEARSDCTISNDARGVCRHWLHNHGGCPAGNQLTGTLPAAMAALPFLEGLSLDANFLQGRPQVIQSCAIGIAHWIQSA